MAVDATQKKPRVDTGKVKGRRKVRYETFEDLVADAERLSQCEVTSLGNWSLGQTLKHIGAAMHGSIDGPAFNVPWWLKAVGRVYLWRKLVYGPFPAGFILPRSTREKIVFKEDTSYEDGMAMLQSGIQRLRSEPQRIVHPVTGPLTREQWDRFHLTHAEMHMSFLLPATDAAKTA